MQVVENWYLRNELRTSLIKSIFIKPKTTKQYKIEELIYANQKGGIKVIKKIVEPQKNNC